MPVFTDVIGDFADFAPGVPTAWFGEFIVEVYGVHELYSVSSLQIYPRGGMGGREPP